MNPAKFYGAVFPALVLAIFVAFLTTSSFALAANVDMNHPEIKRAQKILDKYWKADSVFMRVNKKVILSLLGRETESSGVLLFSKGKLRIDFK